MHLVHKEDHVPAAADLRQHIPESFLKFATIFRTRHQVGHIQADEPLFLQLGRHIPRRHPLGKPFGDGCLAYARFSYQGGIILMLPAEDADDHVDLPVPADDRFHVGRFQQQILAELFQ